MQDSKRCSKCLLPASLPSVRLDGEGICNVCRRHEKATRKWEAEKADKKREFKLLVDKVKRLNRPYDCMILLSGGKDSTYALYVCDKVYQMRCLCVTFDNGFLSDYARMNIKNSLERTGAEHIFYSLNRAKMMELYKIFLKRAGTFCAACMRGIGSLMTLAEKFKIPVIISGTGERISYLGMLPELYQGGELGFFGNVLKDEGIETKSGLLSGKPSPLNARRIVRGFCKLVKIPDPTLKHYVSLFDYMDRPSDEELIKILSDNMGWQKPEGKYEHMDCLAHGVAGFIQTLKFPELAKSTLYLSGQVRSGVISREKALENEKEEKAQQKKVPDELDEFLRAVKMTRDEFFGSVQDWRKIEKYRTYRKGPVRSLAAKVLGN